MKYLARLKSEKQLTDELPKLPKPPFDSFDSTKGRHFPENEPPTQPLTRKAKAESTLTPLRRATSYPCGKCGNQTYREIVAGWLCENCGAKFPFIGGTRGPELIH